MTSVCLMGISIIQVDPSMLTSGITPMHPLSMHACPYYIRLLRPPISILGWPSLISPLRPTTNS